MDHAAYGVQVLFEEGMIRQFVPEDTWDDIIRTAIASTVISASKELPIIGRCSMHV